ncbi:MAG: 4Fe-4S dicluster domain-containing protein [Desulforhopalus sp.]
MAEPRGTVTIETSQCKGCGLCIVVCPVKIIAFKKNFTNSKGYQPAVINEPADCTGCGSCSLMCPDSVITVQRSTQERRTAHV